MLKDWTFLETCHQVWSPFLAFVNKSGLLSGFAKIKINSVEDVIRKFIKYFKQNKVEEKFKYINKKACELANKAREISKENILIAGSLPPQNGTYVVDERDINIIKKDFK